MELEQLCKEVLERIKPSPAERERLESLTKKLLARVNRACKKLGVPARGVLVGSAARGTWLRFERDIDIFILFPEEVPREELERRGLEVAREVMGERGKEQYAEHPYLSAELEGFQVDLVPCYDIEDPSKIKSAVDRTPHHNRYIRSRLTPELAEQVLLLKQFMHGVGIYGAELRVRGFSGYLCELLTLYHGSFLGVIGSAKGWRPGVVVDLEGAYPDPSEARGLFRGEPLVVIDPVDSNRNAAAAVSMQNFAIFVRACQDFLRKPSPRFFFPRLPPLWGPRRLEEELKRRGTTLLCISFTPPKVVPDILYPQLRKAERTLRSKLERAGFGVLRSDVWSNGFAALLLELSVGRLPRVEPRLGPPISVGVGGFVDKHREKKIAGPFVDESGRLRFEVERKLRTAKQVVKLTLLEGHGLGKHVAESISQGHTIYQGRQILKLCRDEGFARFLTEYLTRCLPWYRG